MAFFILDLLADFTDKKKKIKLNTPPNLINYLTPAAYIILPFCMTAELILRSPTESSLAIHYSRTSFRHLPTCPFNRLLMMNWPSANLDSIPNHSPSLFTLACHCSCLRGPYWKTAPSRNKDKYHKVPQTPSDQQHTIPTLSAWLTLQFCFSFLSCCDF